MLYLYKNPTDALGEEIEDKLLEMSAAHQIVVTEEPSHLAENDVKIKSRSAIFSFLESYQQELNTPHSISADACRVDPCSGKIC